MRLRRAATRPRILVTAAALAMTLSACAQMAPYIPTGGPPPVTLGAGNPAAPASASTPGAPAATGTSGAPATAAATPPRQVSAAAKAAKAQLGVQIYWHDLDDAATVKAYADRLLDYVVGLGANSVSISFPFYTDGVTPTKTYVTAGKTPSPATLSIILTEAKARGLRTMVRPLLDETNIIDAKGDWRGSIRPVDTARWFTSYQGILDPYLDVAQATHTDSFVVGTELDSLVSSREWQTLLTDSARRFSGQLSYADNWGQWATGRPAVAGAGLGLDAYPQLTVNDNSTVAQLTAAWTAWFRHRSAATLAKTVVQEVGISATDGAYKNPVAWEVPGESIDPQIQIKWFAAACDSARALRMPGMYFWVLDVYSDPAQGPTYGAGSFIGRGDQSIKSCFATGWPGQ